MIIFFKKTSHLLICSIDINSLGLWAWSIFPGPHTIVSIGILLKTPASVPKLTVPVILVLRFFKAKFTILLFIRVFNGGKLFVMENLKINILLFPL